ncbi:hypothetical protein [Ekhidna sp.]|uniref:hypothetical protein n=1 Tax=Ekhidna sp. TaxID=2608089 RepID=UPI0032E2E865
MTDAILSPFPPLRERRMSDEAILINKKKVPSYIEIASHVLAMTVEVLFPFR